MGFLFAVCFASGVGLLFFGLLYDVRLPDPTSRLRALLDAAGVPLDARLFLLLCAAAGTVAGLVVFALLEVPVLGIAAGLGCAWTPIARCRARCERAKRERERAWPAVISQLADSLEAGLAFPAAVALAAHAGPSSLRDELALFHTRLRTSGIDAALEGLGTPGERMSDTVVRLLRAGLVDVPSGRIAPEFRKLARLAGERFEAAEKARSRTEILRAQAAVFSFGPPGLLLAVSALQPKYLDVYKTFAGTLVGIFVGFVIIACYVLMRRLGRVSEPGRTAEMAR
jgi:Flp pilus assembly protein TadB